jgi:hypothetical protein
VIFRVVLLEISGHQFLVGARFLFGFSHYLFVINVYF